MITTMKQAEVEVQNTLANLDQQQQLKFRQSNFRERGLAIKRLLAWFVLPCTGATYCVFFETKLRF